MKNLRLLLLPFSFLYGAIVAFRNYLFHKNILKSSEFDVSTICVGNLSTGGTGKTPHIEYLIKLLQNTFKTATLSRGYGRKEFGFKQANETSTCEQIGDEPLQFYTKFNKIDVYVEAKRVTGIIEIMTINPQTEVILLDDAFQHRAVKAGFNILLTEYSKPFFNDYILPAGNLRESKKGANRADVIIVTKCPNALSKKEMIIFENKLNLQKKQKVYFSKIKYGEIKAFNTNLQRLSFSNLKNYEILLITGIANPKSLLKELENYKVKYKHLKFPDHHNFTKKNISNIINIFEGISNKKEKIILTTEKDAVRLKSIKELNNLPIYYLEIEIELIKNKQEFNNQILTYVKQN